MNISLTACINKLSYGIVGIQILSNLIKQGHNVSLFPIGRLEVESEEHKKYVEIGLENAKYYDKNAPSVRIYHQNKLDEFVGSGVHVGFPIFELNKFSALELHHLNSCDHLFVCSDWARAVLSDNGVKPRSSTIPLGVDTSVFYPKKQTGSKFIFLNVGKFEVRKGHPELLSAFNRWSVGKNTELWLMPTNQFNSQEENAYWNSLIGENVRVIPLQNTQEDVARIMNMADCGIFPTKAEGWCLPILEMMACGKPVITTNYSGHTQYCNSENSHFINKEVNLESAYDGKWFFGQGEWMSISEENIESALSFYYPNKRFNEEGVLTANKFTWENTAKKMVGELEKLI